MRILQILPELNVGGVETGVVDLARHLVRQGHHVVVVSHGGSLVPELTAAGAVHHALPVHEKSPWTMLRLVPRLTRLLREEHIDLVHARSRVPAWIAWAACRRAGVTFLTTCHGYYSRHPTSRVMGWGKLVIVPSHVIGRHMMDAFRVPLSRIRLIPRGVRLERLTYQAPVAKPNGDYVVGIVGRLTPIKGHAVFLRALARVARQFPQVRAVVVGDAPEDRPQYRTALERLTRQLGLERRVEFLGTRQDVPDLLRRMDLLAMPSRSAEAFGRAVIEAQAAGVPVVASRVGGIVDIIEDRLTGLLAPPEEPVALAEAMASLLADRDLAARLAEAARAKVEQHFSIERMAALTLAAYREAFHSHRILVTKLGAAGDVVLAAPSLRAIRQAFPQAWIAVLVGLECREILQRCPHLDEMLVYDRRGKDRGWWGLWRLGRRLRACAFDLTIDLQNNRATHWLACISGAPKRYGYGGRPWSRLLTHCAKLPADPTPPVEHQFRVLRLAGIAASDGRLELWPGASDEERVARWLAAQWVGPQQPLVALHPGGSPAWPTKRWLPDRWAKLCDALGASNVRVVLTGSAAELPLGRRIAALTRAKPILAMGQTTLVQLACLLRRCQALVTSDSAPLHVAAAVGTPVTALFGPTDPRRHSPPAQQLTVLRKDLPCSPCYGRHCRILTHACMKQITVEEVLAAARAHLAAAHRAAPVEAAR